MPWKYPDNVPSVAKNWTPTEQKACVIAGNAVLGQGGSDKEAIFACIHAAGKGKHDVFDALFGGRFSLLQAAKQKRGKRKMPKPPRPANIRPVQIQYLKRLRIMLKDLFSLTREIVISALPNLLAGAAHVRPDRKDDYFDEVEQIIARLKKKFDGEYTDSKRFDIIMEAAERAEGTNSTYFRNLAIKIFGIDIGRSEPWLKQEMSAFVRTNMDLVGSIADEHIDRVKNLMLLGTQQGWRHEELAKEIEGKFGVAENKAKLIARDQVSKFNASLTEFRMKEAGVEKYEWSTSGDERVRESHAEKDGKIFSWSDPPADTGNPGEDINCRCVAIPVLEDLKQEE